MSHGTTLAEAPNSAAAGLWQALAGVLAEGDADAIARLRYARARVSFVVGGEGVTLALDGEEPALEDYDEHADIELELDDDQAWHLARGLVHMPTELEGGAVRTRGPVRRYLEVDPILRAELRRRAGTVGRPAREVYGDGRTPGTFGDDLLAIQTRGVHKAFGSARILRGVNLALPEGVISVVLGPSGTGKSVLLNHVIGLMRPDRGEVLVRGRSLNRMTRAEILALRLEVGVMFQDGALFSALNVYDNVAFPLRQHTDLPESAVHDIVMRHLESVGLAHSLDRRPAQLSGGMRKRAGLARALVLDPGIILCDEPDSGLDPVRTALLGELLVEQHGAMGGTMVVITHNIALAKRIAEHVSVLWRGEIMESGSAQRILASDNEFIQQFLAGSVDGPLTMDA